MAKTLEERAAVYVAKIRTGFEERHPYFAEGFEGKYSSLIEAAISEGIISERYAAILRRRLAGEPYSAIAKAGGRRGQNVDRRAIYQSHKTSLTRLKKYVSTHMDRFDKLHLEETVEEVGNAVKGKWHRPATAYEETLYKAYLAQRSRAEAAEERNAELEARLEQAQGEYISGAGYRGTPRTIDAQYYEMPISDFGVPRRVVNSLIRHSVKRERLAPVTSIGELAEFSEYELRNFDDAGKRNIQYIMTALGYLGLSLRGSGTVHFPTGEALSQSPTNFILYGFISRKLAAGNIKTIGQLANASDERLSELLSADAYEDTTRIMRFYERALQGLRAA
ncbi:hypothetical protein HYV82_00865 [Candidatus Woesearchaeota archaeon]|nr:hypothetical protein [Candidatus Woesearchaeota archaeon]